MRQFWIDVGGTFTDCLLRETHGAIRSCKVLSSGRIKGRVTQEAADPRILEINLRDFPAGFFSGYRVRLHSETGEREEEIPVRRSEAGRLFFDRDVPSWAAAGTRVEIFSGEPAPILGMRMLLGLDLEASFGPAELRLGTTRATNALLERKGVRTAWVTTRGFEDVLTIGNQDRPRLFDLHIQKSPPLFERTAGIVERIDAEGRVIVPLDIESARESLAVLKREGIQSLAVGLMNAYRNGEHEHAIRRLAEPFNFQQISLSSEVSPTLKIVPRGDTTLVDAYLTPVIRGYFDSISRKLPEVTIRVMTSAGVLSPWEKVSGKDLILSGPAGGVVGFARAARETGMDRAVGFDMGGTSTDVSRFDGEFEYEFETRKAGVRIVAPMLSIETVAAGGGSICRFDGQKLTVGPESAGADPGPACYGRSGPLAVTDLNVFLGRIPAERFPFRLDRDAVQRALSKVKRRIEASGGQPLSERDIAEGFLRIANGHMAAAIKRISVARGYDIREYGLVSFGGAAGQHACAVARELGMTRILVHPLASLLSAYGMGVAELSEFAVESVLRPLNAATVNDLQTVFERMAGHVRESLFAAGTIHENPETRCQLEVRYRGQSTALTVPHGSIEEIRAGFETQHRQLYGHVFEGREVEVVNARLQMTLPHAAMPTQRATASARHPASLGRRPVVFEGREQSAESYEIGTLEPGAEIEGPALLIEPYSTVVLEPGWSARVTEQGHLLLEAKDPASVSGVSSDEVNAIDLEIFNNHFASIAEQMGATLRRTALSVNVKERLDFSCAIFTATGDLVANAPHVPVHLGAMSECVKQVLQDVPDLVPGDVILTNDPFRGGSHLPDLTVITPVFDRESGELLFLTGNRAHHAEMGGIRPGSMPPDSRTLAEEGVLIRNFRIVKGGEPRFESLKRQLTSGPYPSRSPDDNLADVSAQIAANRQGSEALRMMLDRFGRQRTLDYMGHIQRAAEAKMRDCLRRLGDGVFRFSDALDDGSPVCVAIHTQDGSATLDFEGSAPVHPGNLNANRAIVTAAVIYAFRCLIGEDIPLNSGVLAPLELVIPEGMLNPKAQDDPKCCPAVVGGNVETSQRIVDVILGALGAAAASQGTMNNLTFGNENFGYYETICGGAGAGPGFNGADAVHTHMTNTRLTDAEVLELEYPVRLRRFEIRRGSGGAGAFRGGDGAAREMEFLAPVSVSLLTQRRQRSPFGLAGGKPGAPGRNRLFRAGESGEGRDLGGIASFEALPGDRLVVETPGGGGYGSGATGA